MDPSAHSTSAQVSGAGTANYRKHTSNNDSHSKSNSERRFSSGKSGMSRPDRSVAVFTGQMIRDSNQPDSPAESVNSSSGEFDENGEMNGDIVADGHSIPVRLEKLPTTHGQKRYVLKVEGDLKSILQDLEKEYDGDATRAKNARRRKRFSDLVFTRQFTAFDRLNPESSKSPFYGFYTLFWLGVFIMVVQTAANSYRATGSIFGHDITDIMFKPKNFIDCMFMDFVMCFITEVVCVPLQKSIGNGTITWAGAGWVIQSVWEILHLVGVIYYTLYRDWPWIQTVFIVLHTIVILMKQHSYAFYNGHLSQVYKRAQIIKRTLKQLDDAEDDSSLVASHGKLERRYSAVSGGRPHPSELVNDPVINAGLSGLPLKDGDELTSEQVDQLRKLLLLEQEAGDFELGRKEGVMYPQNLTWFNYFEYLFFPTVVYELEYPRTSTIDWSYVAEKMVATFGVLAIMVIVSQHYILPVVIQCNAMRAWPIQDRLKEFPWILNELVVPFIIEYMMVWYLIWECILNLLGELTRFADRGFYGSWWNSTTWDQFARDWNKPVHNFLLRHVYHSSISAWQVSKPVATLITFFLSSIVHELVMWCIFKKLRGYLLCMQMLQVPLVLLSRTRLLKNRQTLGNVLFWLGIYTGPSFLCSLYLII